MIVGLFLTQRRHSQFLIGLLGLLLAGAEARGAAPALVSSDHKESRAAAAGYSRTVVPLLTRYCYPCHGEGKHKGDVRLDAWPDNASAFADRALWQRVLRVVQHHEMPPSKKPQPSRRERELLLEWIDRAVFDCDCRRPDPGRVTLRRLNRAEYNNTIRDLLGVDFKPAQDFPVDDSGHGFDNIGDALSMPPLLAEKYLRATQTILDAALGAAGAGVVRADRYPVDLLEVGYNAKQRGDGWVALNSIEEDDVAVEYTTPAAGEYALRVRAWARQDGTNAIKLAFMLGSRPVEMIAIETNATAPRVYETRLPLAVGKHRLRAVVRRVKDGLSPAEALQWKKGPQQKGAVFVEWLEVAGPLGSGEQAPSPAREQIFPALPPNESKAARAILQRFVPRAWRRPVAKDELDRLVALAEAARRRFAEQPDANGATTSSARSFENGIRVALQAVLISPHFLFRGELQPEPDNPKQVRAINEFALASRLSYFLWSTMPDDELFALAARGRLRKNLEEQTRRMLSDPKARALVENFGGQWLQTRQLDLIAPDAEKFAAFDEELRSAMKRETELFFDHVRVKDCSVLDFLEADYTFVNQRLAKHYGLRFEPANAADIASTAERGEPDASRARAGETGPWVRASLAGTPRRGVLTHAGILALTSNPTRTSPVKRGKWVLENLLNSPPPPPPPNVPELKEGKESSGTLRQRMEQHRADPLCASCHERMDAIGFGLENFDGIGAWRTTDGGTPIDAAGELNPDESFDGPAGLMAALAQKRHQQFVRCLAEKMLTYALGRGMEYPDKCALDPITQRVATQGHRFSAFVLEIVKSVPFQFRRGDGD